MDELISRKALIAAMGLEDSVKYGNKSSDQQHRSYSTWMSYEIADEINGAPTIDPVRHARWDINKSPSGIVTHRCTNCRCEPPRRTWRAKPYAFCPDCGARMDAEVLSKMETTTEEEKDG